MSNILRLDATIVAKTAFAAFLNQPVDTILCKPLTGGSEESPVLKCTYDEADYLVKLFTDTTFGKNEIAWTQLASDLGIGPELYHADPAANYMIYDAIFFTCVKSLFWPLPSGVKFNEQLIGNLFIGIKEIEFCWDAERR